MVRGAVRKASQRLSRALWDVWLIVDFLADHFSAPIRPTGVYLASGVFGRCGLFPADYFIRVSTCPLTNPHAPARMTFAILEY